MPLAPGTRLGPYEIVSPLGAGGMGEVYKGTDTRLPRSVAIKVIGADLVDQTDRMRFQREARAVAALDHPHICTLHDLGDHEGTNYLVFELLHGETLAARIARGPLPIADVLTNGMQMADGLDHAHRLGIIHRDLKPQNVMLVKSGVKLLDFGLARIVPPDSPGATTILSSGLTGPGAVVGTPPYLAPERIDGRDAGVGSDIFALGAVLYEMTTGRRAFDGTTSAAIIGSIMKGEPVPLLEVRPDAPPPLVRIIRTCLAKDPDDRFHCAHDVLIALQWVKEDAGRVVHVDSTSERRPEWRSWLAATAVTLAALLGVWLGIRVADATRQSAPAVVQFVVTVPDGYQLAPSTKAALSPNGRMVVFGASDANGVTGLWLRTLDEERPRPLPGTEDAAYAFWSPDNSAVAFFANKQLKRVEIAGGPSFTVCEAESGRGGTWNAAGDILFAPSPSSPLLKVPASGGTPIPITVLGAADNGHRAPFFLPDGDHFLYFSLGKSAPDSVLRVDSLSRPGPRTVLSEPTSAEYAGGLLYFVRRGALVAQRFDVQTLALTGDARAITEDLVGFHTGIYGHSVSSTGATSFLRAFTTPAQVQLTWMTRDGRAVGTVGPAGELSQPSLSPDGKTVAVVRRGDDQVNNVWTIEVARGSATRLTRATFAATGPLWTPDGKRVTVTSRDRVDDAFVMSSIAVDGTGPPQVLVTDQFARYANGWSADQSSFFFEAVDERGSVSLWRRPVSGGEPQALRRDGFINRGARLSPDGRWIAYASNQSGRFEVYVESVVTPGRSWQVSTAGGVQARWSHDQRELYFLSPEGWLTAAPLTLGAELTIGAAKPLFDFRTLQTGNDPDARLILGAAHQYDVASDGRFLIAAVQRDAVTRRDILVSLGRPR